MKKTDSLIFRLGVIFLLFILGGLILSGVNAYLSQRAILQKQCEERLANIAKHLERLVTDEGRLFIDFQKYFIKHSEEILVPLDFDGNWQPQHLAFIRLMRSHYPGKTLGVDISFDQLDDEVKMAYVTYMHRRWLTIFENTAKDLGIIYAYYLVPSSTKQNMIWMIDGVREKRIVDGKEYIKLCTDVHEPLEEHRHMWLAWDTGKPVSGYDYYDNQFGRTYAYYIGVHIDGEKTGVIGTEIEIANVNRTILFNAIIHTLGMGIILIAGMTLLLYIIYHKYIAKIERLQDHVLTYANEKNVIVAEEIRKDGAGSDEISVLARQTADMITKLEDYIQNLAQTKNELGQEKKRAERDALTGIRNKFAYDEMVQQIQMEMESGKADFAIALIDLNFLKAINDNYGHDIGNFAIKKLCQLVCAIFKHSPVFRIGGDEFVAILEKDDLANRASLQQEFNSAIEKLSSDTELQFWERTSAALGIAVYDPFIDNDVDSVFRRADKMMNANKKEIMARQSITLP